MNATVAAIEARKDARRVLDLVPNQRLIWREATHFPAGVANRVCPLLVEVQYLKSSRA